MEHMSPLDAAFWQLEDSHAGLHIASVAVFEGPPPSIGQLRRLYARKLHLVPRLRQRMRPVLLGLGRPAWVDDPTFDLAYHLRHTAVPHPGGPAQLSALMGRLMSNHLDPERPLWEAWVVDGLAHGRWAIVSKLHHSMVDGIAGISVLERIFDTSPDAALPPPDRWEPEPQPGPLGLVRSALVEDARAAADAARATVTVGAHPRRSARRAAGVVQGLGRYATALRPVPASRLSGRLGAPRGYDTASVRMADVQRVRDRLGGSINDVVLAIVTGALRELILSRHERLVPHEVRCLVPVSVRALGAHDELDNRVSALLADLPVEIADPVQRYVAVCAHTRALKASHEAEAGVLVTTVARYLPPPLLTLGLRTVFRLPQRWITTVITNVPGPPRPIYALGRRLIANYPYVPIADRVRIGVAVTSYDRTLHFGITSDHDSAPDAGVLRAGIERGIGELLDGAAVRSQQA